MRVAIAHDWLTGMRGGEAVLEAIERRRDQHRDLGADRGVPEVVAENARHAFARAASAFYPRRPGVIVAVTGTNGKSSTVDFLRQIWTHTGKRAASLGTLGAIGPNGVIDLGHTTPDPASVHATLTTLAEQGVTHAAMEASSHGLEQHRIDGVTFAAGAFTHVPSR